MKRKTLITAVVCFLLAFGSLSVCAMAQESTEKETEEAEKTEETAEAGEESTEEETEEETEAEPRPEYDALDYVELGDYIGLTVQVTPIEITDDEVMAEADARIRDSEAMVSVDVVEEGDTVDIDYEGTMDGEVFDGGSAEGYELEIGSGTFIDGFEDGLIGASVGDTVELELTFPDYYYEDLAGQDVLFTVTVNEILRLPELTDEVVSTVTDGAYTDVDSWLEYLRFLLEQDASYYWEYQVQTGLLYALEENSVVTGFPQDLYEYLVNQMISYYGEDLLEEYYGDAYMDTIQGTVEESLRGEMVLKAVAEKEDLALTDEEYETALEEYALYSGYSSPELLEEEVGEQVLYDWFLESKVYSFLESNADIQEVTAEEGRDYEIVYEETETDEEDETEAVTEAETETETETDAEAETETETEETKTE